MNNSSHSQVARLTTGSLPGWNVELQFDLAGDRYGHCFWIADGRSKIKFMSSIEGNANQDWPPSPPVQDLLLENRQDYQVVLGVGQAGSAHWSSSFRNFADREILEIEHACKSDSNEHPVGSLYQIAADWHVDRRSNLVKLSRQDVAIEIATQDECIEDGQNQIRILKRTGAMGSNPKTVTWLFQVGMSQNR